MTKQTPRYFAWADGDVLKTRTITDPLTPAPDGWTQLTKAYPAPLDEGSGKARVLRGTQVVVVDDHRGTIFYSTTDGSESKVDYIGDIKSGYTTEPRPSPHHKWQDDSWQLDEQAYQAAAIAAIKQAIQQHIDTTAHTKEYDNGVSCASYAGYDNPYQAEAIVFAKWRSDVWQAVTQLQAQTTETSATPSADDVIAQLPTIDW